MLEKSGILKYSYFDVSTSETDTEIVGDVSVEEEDKLKFYINDLVEALADVKNMLSQRKDEICSITDDNGFSGIGSSEYFGGFYNDNLADMTNNWSNIEENENIIHSEID